jgi:hypothetical protein
MQLGPFVSGGVQERCRFTPPFKATSILYFPASGLTRSFFKNAEEAEAT